MVAGAVAEADKDRQGVAIEHALEHAAERSELVVAVAWLVHQGGVDADGGVVEEQPITHAGDVHASFRASDEGLDGGRRVGAVQTFAARR